MQPKVELIRHTVEKVGIHGDEQKIERIKDLLTPKMKNNLGHLLVGLHIIE